MWDDLRKEFLNLDAYGTGFVSAEEFRDVLQELCVHLNAYELDMLSRKFDTQNDGRYVYITSSYITVVRYQYLDYVC